MHTRIVKVQLSLVSSHATRRALIYDQPRTFSVEIDADAKLVKRMRGTDKQFFYAHVFGNGSFELGNLAPWQDW